MGRLWTIATVAREFGVLPSVVARDLDNDPEQLSIVCLEMLRYAEAKAAFDTADSTVLKRWEGSPTMEIVTEIAFALEEERSAMPQESEA